VSANRLGLRVIEVLLVEGANALSALGRVLFRIVWRQRTHDGQPVCAVAKLVDAKAIIVLRLRAQWLRLSDVNVLALAWGRRCDLETVAVARRADDASGVRMLVDDSRLRLNSWRIGWGRGRLNWRIGNLPAGDRRFGDSYYGDFGLRGGPEVRQFEWRRRRRR
jgi:hypothetical protein